MLEAYKRQPREVLGSPDMTTLEHGAKHRTPLDQIMARGGKDWVTKGLQSVEAVVATALYLCAFMQQCIMYY